MQDCGTKQSSTLRYVYTVKSRVVRCQTTPLACRSSGKQEVPWSAGCFVAAIAIVSKQCHRRRTDWAVCAYLLLVITTTDAVLSASSSQPDDHMLSRLFISLEQLNMAR